MENRENFIKIVPNEYFKPVRAIDIQKTAQVMAVQAQGGEAIVTRMANGLVETQNTAKAGDYIITNPGGEQYVIGAAKFAARYTAAKAPNMYAPVSSPLKAIRLTEDVQFQAPWGEQMYVARGGVLVSAGAGDVYGIQSQAFQDTYSVLIMRGVKEGISRVGIKNIAAGVGVGISAYSLYHKINDDQSRYNKALNDPETSSLAKTTIVLDAASLGVSSASLAMHVHQNWNSAFLNGVRNTPMLMAGAKYLGYAGIAIRLTSAAVDFEVARRNRDAPHMRDVFAETAGGMAGGLALGVAGMKLGAVIGGTIGSVVPVLGTATGAAVGGTVLGVVGSIAGSVGGADALKYGLSRVGDGWLKSMFSHSVTPTVSLPAEQPDRTARKVPLMTRESLDRGIESILNIDPQRRFLCTPTLSFQ